MLSKKTDVQRLGLSILDSIAVILSAFLVMRNPHAEVTHQTIVILVILHFAVFHMSNAFKHFSRRGYFEELKALLYYSIWMILGISFISFTSKQSFEISRTGMFSFIFLNVFFCYVLHALVKWYMSKRATAFGANKVFLITTMDRLSTTAKRMEEAKNWGGIVSSVAIADSFDVTQEEISEYFPHAELVGWDKIQEYVVYNVVDEIFVNLSNDYDELAIALIRKFEVLGTDISLNIRQFDVPSETIKKVQRLGGHQVVTFSQKFYHQGELVIKRIMDIMGGLVGIIITIVVGIFLVPAIMLESPGAPIYSQNRVGKNGRIFKFYKFRSMYMDADERKAELMKENQMSGLMFKMENDPRITKVGKFIRKTSLDELPQFFNVIKGDMSLVGTRPPTEQEYLEYDPSHKRRLSFKPGITGLWQVSGRNEITNFDDVVKLDVEYIQNWNIGLDIKILLLTVKVVCLGKGAK